MKIGMPAFDALDPRRVRHLYGSDNPAGLGELRPRRADRIAPVKLGDLPTSSGQLREATLVLEDCLGFGRVGRLTAIRQRRPEDWVSTLTDTRKNGGERNKHHQRQPQGRSWRGS